MVQTVEYLVEVPQVHFVEQHRPIPEMVQDDVIVPLPVPVVQTVDVPGPNQGREDRGGASSCCGDRGAGGWRPSTSTGRGGLRSRF